MESMGCLRWLLMLVPMSLLTALGLGVTGGPVPLPPAPISPYDAAYFYTTQDGTLQFPYLPGWTVMETTPGIISMTNSTDWARTVENQELQSGEFVISVISPQALLNFGVDPSRGPAAVIETFQMMQAPDAVYGAPIPVTIGGREALRVDITNSTISIENRFYVYALQWDRVAVVTMQTLPGEGFLADDLLTGLMERMTYFGDTGYATPTLYDGGTMPYPTPYPIATLPPVEIFATPQFDPPTLVIPTATGAFTVELDTVNGAGDINAEAVILRFNGNALMENWSLRSADGWVYFVFPSMLVYEGSRVAVHSGFGENTPLDLYAGYSTAQWQSGQTVFLYDSANRLMDSVVIP